jgi:hypothetical protein
MSELAFAIAQLRHAYAQLAVGAVKDQKQFADGLIAPQIRALECAALRSLPEREEIARVLTMALFKAEFEVMTSWTQKDMRDAADAVIAHLSGCEQQVESDK